MSELKRTTRNDLLNGLKVGDKLVQHLYSVNGSNEAPDTLITVEGIDGNRITFEGREYEVVDSDSPGFVTKWRKAEPADEKLAEERERRLILQDLRKVKIEELPLKTLRKIQKALV